LSTGEVVTEAKVRYLDVPAPSASTDGEREPLTFALITLDNGHDHTRPNTFGPEGLASLSRAIDSVEEKLQSGVSLAGVAVTGKPFVFSVGADLKVFSQLKSREDVVDIGQRGHQVFGRLGELSIPSFAFVNGAAMGGGLELTLNCSYRTVDASARALALPEVFLGLIPGWGGSYLLPRLIGTARAAQVIIANPLNMNTMLTPKKALELGVVDAVFEPADFLEQSLQWAAAVTRGAAPVRHNFASEEANAWDAPLDMALAEVEARVRGASPAPYRAIELMLGARTASQSEAFAAEDQALADLTVSPELAASLYAFDLVNKRAKRPAGVPEVSPRTIGAVGIIGAGLMASQLAVLFARRLDVPVHMVDVDHERAVNGLAAAHGELNRLVAKGRLSPDRCSRLTGQITSSTDIAELTDADFVIEAVFEDLDVKAQVLKSVEAVVAPSTLLATNTSSLSVSALAESLQRPERLVGFHFFNPVAVMPLLEVVRGTRTDDSSVSTAFQLAKDLKKSAVLVHDAPAFVVNRLLTRLLNEVLAAIDAGSPVDVVEHALDPLGLPMSPLALLDLVGPAVALHVSRTMQAAFPQRFTVSKSLERLVESGATRFYLAPDTAHGRTPATLDPAVLAQLTQLEQGNAPMTSGQVHDRVLRALADEIDIMLADGVVSEVQDVDLCLLLGAGWPFWLGGITPLLDRTGITAPRTQGPFHHGRPRAFSQ